MFTEEQLKGALARIGYTGEVSVTKECLDALIFTHQCNVPYDNLNTYDYGIENFLDAESLYKKIVEDHRGGYCFELNGFFYRILKGIGFDVVPCFCRIMFGAKLPEDNFIDHRGSIVTLDGQRYYCDVGTGAPMPLAALPIVEDVWTNTRGMEFCIKKGKERNWYELFRKVGEYPDGSPIAVRDLYFLDATVQEIDFVMLNSYMQLKQDTLPHVRRMVSRKTPNGYLDITDNVFTRVENGVKTQQKLTAAELFQVIREEMDLNITEPLKEIEV